MAKMKRYEKWGIPSTVVTVVCSICSDYARRKSEIGYGTTTEDVLDECKRLNAVIECALEDIEVGIRWVIFEDITYRRGYVFSPCSAIIAKNTYYKRKRKLIHDIAIGLHLIA